MKKLFIIIIIILGAYIFKIPKYNELNNLAIIESIAVEYDGTNYTLYLKEIIPTKNDQGIKYNYKYYQEKDKTIESSYKKIKEKTKKKLYLKRCKFLITNIHNSENIIKILSISPEIIYHEPNNIYEKLKKI